MLGHTTTLVTLLALLGLAGCDGGGGGAESCPDPAPADTAAADACEAPASYEPVPETPTPPLPGDECPEPPSAGSQLFEAAAGGTFARGNERADDLLDPARITVITCGTGSPLPTDRAESCTAVFVGGQFLLFDAGNGAQRSMEDLQLPVDRLTAVFLTHFHSDHIADLGEVISRSWILGRQAALPVYGSPAVERVVDGFNLVYTADEVYRRAHHGEDVFPSDVVLPAEARRFEDPGADGAIVYEEGGVVVKAYRVDHSPVPVYGYRVEFGGRAVGISGDTLDVPGLRNLADAADVLVADVMDKPWVLDAACAFERLGQTRNASMFRDIRTYHLDVAELAQLAVEAKVGTLMLTHLVPGLPPAQAQDLYGPQIEAVYGGTLVVSEDGSTVTLDIE